MVWMPNLPRDRTAPRRTPCHSESFSASLNMTSRPGAPRASGPKPLKTAMASCLRYMSGSSSAARSKTLIPSFPITSVPKWPRLATMAFRTFSLLSRGRSVSGCLGFGVVQGARRPPTKDTKSSSKAVVVVVVVSTVAVAAVEDSVFDGALAAMLGLRTSSKTNAPQCPKDRAAVSRSSSKFAWFSQSLRPRHQRVNCEAHSVPVTSMSSCSNCSNAWAAAQRRLGW
mmetsp:Transcript_76948/g.160110  ORF Transcript_76948/g.160110 Transcript_76948/m.160110 type:complete len:227 (-) Transcript_76948:1556-2236(-)